MLAINTMQDVVEAVLYAAGERKLASLPKRPDFDKLFDGVAAALGDPAEIIGLRSAAIAMNNARVGFKHHGNQLRDETLRRHLDVAVTLTNAVVESAFDMPLERVSMLLFIRDDQARDLIERASKYEAAGDLTQALFSLRLAFDLVVWEYESRKSVDGWHSIFDTKPNFFPSTLDLRDMGKGAEKISEWIAALDRLTRLGALGIDLQRYAYFDAVAPLARRFASRRAPMPQVRFTDLTGEHYRASYLFVVDTAIKLGANDYTLVTSRWASQGRERFDPDHEPRADRLPEIPSTAKTDSPKSRNASA